jgi:zona occludens toxin (predicted ATPase)
LPSGNSGENAMNHFPSRTIRAVKVAAFFINVICSQWEIVASAEFVVGRMPYEDRPIQILLREALRVLRAFAFRFDH